MIRTVTNIRCAPHRTHPKARRRSDLLELLDRLNPTIAELSQAVEKEEVENFPEAQRLMTHPEVGALTALAIVLIIGNPERFELVSRWNVKVCAMTATMRAFDLDRQSVDDAKKRNLVEAFRPCSSAPIISVPSKGGEPTDGADIPDPEELLSAVKRNYGDVFSYAAAAADGGWSFASKARRSWRV